MFQVEFIFNQINIIIQCNKDEKMKEIYNKFIKKTGFDINSIIFIYNENQITNEELTIEQISNENDKLTKHIKILVKEITNSEGNTPDKNNIIKTKQNISNIKSKEVICPKCGELSNIIIKD